MYLFLLAIAVLVIIIAVYKRAPVEHMAAGCEIVSADYFNIDHVAENFESSESANIADLPEDNREMRGAVYGPRAYLGNPVRAMIGTFV